MDYILYNTITVVARFEVQPDCSVELSPLGLRFLKDIFKKYDKVSFYTYFYFIVLVEES